MESLIDRLTRGHAEQEAKGKAPRPYQLMVELSAQEHVELAALSPNEQCTKFRQLQAERGVVK